MSATSDALAAVDRVFSDTSVSQEETAERLLEIGEKLVECFQTLEGCSMMQITATMPDGDTRHL